MKSPSVVKEAKQERDTNATATAHVQLTHVHEVHDLPLNSLGHRVVFVPKDTPNWPCACHLLGRPRLEGVHRASSTTPIPYHDPTTS